jgi:hypothetical protein
MSEPENFVARWSRLKRQSDPKAAEDADQAPAAQPQAQGEEARIPAAQPPPPAFDPATLPSIESITAGTDIRAFLQSGVPAELTKAALRRVWTTDPAIRDFVGIAENQWDFDPRVPGFVRSSNGRRAQAGRPGHGPARRVGRAARRGRHLWRSSPGVRIAVQHRSHRRPAPGIQHTSVWYTSRKFERPADRERAC